MLRTLSAAIVSLTVLLFATVASATTIDVATNVLNGGSNTQGFVPDGTSSATNQVNYVAFIPNSANSAAVVYDHAGNMANVGPNIYNGVGAAARGPGQSINVDGYGTGIGGTPIAGNMNMFLAGQSPSVNDSGFGAHANWVVTVNLDAIRAADFGGIQTGFQLNGTFGAWGNIGDPTGGVIQGEIFVDGKRIDNMGLTSFTPAINQTFSLGIPASGHELSFFILNGPNSSLWDDGIFQSVTLAAPEPASMVMLGIGVVGLLLARRRLK
jgi:hypothetical protein